ncbi:hypothetical protein LDENG_00144890 [Lucifuga dentata]|nr:hypothetical protein LDENG_00144890 [Lucifuga dentata]
MGPLRARGLQAPAEKQADFSASTQNEISMRLSKCCGGHRRVWVLVMVLGLAGLVLVSLPLFETETSKRVDVHVDSEHQKLVSTYVRGVLEGQCRPGRTRQSLLARLPASSRISVPFLWKDEALPEGLFLFPPPFGFRGLQQKVEDLLKLLPDSGSTPPLERRSENCRRCVVVGNGGILRGLMLGSLIDQFDTIIRLNSGPLGEFSIDVGNRTSIRMSYPEGTPLGWLDSDMHALFVAVVYKGVDISWISAMISKHVVVRRKAAC